MDWLGLLWCTWPWRRHDLYFVRTLITLADVRCRKCSGHWLHKRDEGMIPWPSEADRFFARRTGGQEGRDGE